MEKLLAQWYLQSQQISPVRINRLTRKRLMQRCGEFGFAKGAEIGVDRGTFSEYMFSAIPNLHLLCVDPWCWEQRGEERYKTTSDKLAQYNATIIRKTSLDASFDIEDESLDFVYIDGNHVFDYAMVDLILWAKKVKIGGLIALHDYYAFRGAGVVPAVDVYTRQHGIEQWFLTDEKTPTAFWIRTEEPFTLDQK